MDLGFHVGVKLWLYYGVCEKYLGSKIEPNELSADGTLLRFFRLRQQNHAPLDITGPSMCLIQKVGIQGI